MQFNLNATVLKINLFLLISLFQIFSVFLFMIRQRFLVFKDWTWSSFIIVDKRRFNRNCKLNTWSVYPFLRYKITNHRNLIPGYSTNPPFSPLGIPFPMIKERSFWKYISTILYNTPFIPENKLFPPYNKSIIPRNDLITSGKEIFIPGYCFKILMSAFTILRNIPVIPENKLSTEKIGVPNF